MPSIWRFRRRHLRMSIALDGVGFGEICGWLQPAQHVSEIFRNGIDKVHRHRHSNSTALLCFRKSLEQQNPNVCMCCYIWICVRIGGNISVCFQQKLRPNAFCKNLHVVYSFMGCLRCPAKPTLICSLYKSHAQTHTHINMMPHLLNH